MFHFFVASYSPDYRFVTVALITTRHTLFIVLIKVLKTIRFFNGGWGFKENKYYIKVLKPKDFPVGRDLNLIVTPENPGFRTFI